MNRTIDIAAVAAVVTLAAGCAPGTIDFCGKSCAGSDANCGAGFVCDPSSNTCQIPGGGCPASTGGIGSTGGTGRGTSGGTGGSTSGGTSGAPYLNMPCTPPTGTQTDPCLADDAGLACNPNATFTADSCTLPQEYEPCVQGVGCDLESPPLYCTEFMFPSEGTTWFCVNDCNSTRDCPDPDDTCQSGLTAANICYTDFCGPGSLADGGSVNPGGFYASCDSAGTNDGTCLPYDDDGVYGICEANGSIQANQLDCGNRTPDGGVATLCASGTICVFSDATNNSFCAPLCAATQPPAGPACSAGAGSCESLGDLVGDCEQTCTTASTCPTNLTCQSGFCLP